MRCIEQNMRRINQCDQHVYIKQESHPRELVAQLIYRSWLAVIIDAVYGKLVLDEGQFLR